MKNGILTIMKKELARFFGDKRMVMSILLPGILIYVMYSFMGSAFETQFSVEENTSVTVSISNLPASMETMAKELDVVFDEVEAAEAAKAKEALANGETDLYVVFPEHFDADVTAYDPASGTPAPNVEIYYNTTLAESEQAYTLVTELLNQYESMLSNRFDVNREDLTYDMASEEDTLGSIFASMMPMLLMVFLFSGCMAVAPESIAGEKERGTIATMLITPVKRSEIAIGKIIALAIVALLSGVSSAAGTILSLPKLMGSAAEGLETNMYGVADYGLLAVIILSTVLLLITLISIVSALAKTVKEAQTFVTPMMIVVMVVGITAMFGGGAASELYNYLIPLYNSVQCMVGIFSFEAVPVNVIVTVVSNLMYTGVGVFVLTRMFHSEKIIFSR